MLQFGITKAELQKALADLELATARGFPGTVAVLSLAEVGRFLADDRLVYDERVILAVVDGDPHGNYGSFRAEAIKCYRYKDGKLVYTQKATESKI